MIGCCGGDTTVRRVVCLSFLLPQSNCLTEIAFTLLRRNDVDAWNAFRKSYPEWLPQYERLEMKGAILIGIDFRAVDFSEAAFTRACLRRADMRDAMFRSAILKSADLTGADLRNSNLEYCDLRDSQLRGADLRGA